MKKAKRVISLLLSILMITSVFNGLSITALAAQPPVQQATATKVDVKLSKTIKIAENTNGSLQQNPDGTSTFIYAYEDLLFSDWSNHIYVTMSDGTVVDYQCNPHFYEYGSADGDILEIAYVMTQPNTPWTLGGSNYLKIEIMGITVDVPVEIIKNPADDVASIEFKVANPRTFNQGGNITYTVDEDDPTNPYCKYEYWYLCVAQPGNELIATSNDGTKTVYTYKHDNIFEDANGFEIFVDDITPSQKTNPFVPGSNQIKLSALGKETSVNFEIIPHGIDHFEILTDGVTKIEQYTHGNANYWKSDNSYFYNLYTLDNGPYDAPVKVYYTDGTTDVFINSTNTKNEQIDLRGIDNQDGAEWLPNKENFAVFFIDDIKCTVPIEITPANFKSFEKVSGSVKAYDNWKWYNFGELQYDWDDSDLRFRVNYNDGTSKVIKANEAENYINPQYDTPWTKDGNNYLIYTYGNCVIKEPVEIKAPIAKSVEIIKKPDKASCTGCTGPDYTGMQIRLTYTDGRTADATITKEMMASGYTFTEGLAEGEDSYYNAVLDFLIDGNMAKIVTTYNWETNSLDTNINVVGAELNAPNLFKQDNLVVNSIDTVDGPTNDTKTVVINYNDNKTTSFNINITTGDMEMYYDANLGYISPELDYSIPSEANHTFTVCALGNYIDITCPHIMEQKTYIVDGKEYTLNKCTYCHYDLLVEGSNIEKPADGWALENGSWHYYENGNLVKNEWRYNVSDWSYLNNDGVMVTNAWVRDNSGDFVYLNANGHISRNAWVKDNSKNDVYVNGDGHIVRDTWLHDGVDWVHVDADGHKQVNTWLRDNNNQFIYVNENGYISRNTWIKDHSNTDVYVNQDGYIVRNTWLKDNTDWFFVDADGHKIVSTWLRDNNYQFIYVNENGYITRNTWIKDHSNSDVYVNQDGYIVRNAWVKDNSKNDVYVNGDGHIVRNIWLHDGVDWVNVDAEGHKQVSTWLRDNNYQFIYVNENGYISRNTWVKDHSNTDVYVNQDGYIVRNTWLKDNTDWFFVDADGHKIVSTWLRDNNYQFIYVNENGYISRNTWVKDHSNTDVYVDQDGHIVRSTWLKDSTDWFYVDADGHKQVNTWLRDNNYQFIYVNENGYISRNTWVKDHSNTDVYVNQDGYIVRNAQVTTPDGKNVSVDQDGHIK